MKYFISEPSRLNADMAFLDKLLQMQNDYYSFGSEKTIIREILFELGAYAVSSTVVLISHEDRGQDLVVHISSSLDSSILKDIKMAEDEVLKFFDFEGLTLVQCGIQIDNDLSWTIYLVHNHQEDSRSKILLELALPILKALLTDQSYQFRKLEPLVSGKQQGLMFRKLTRSLDGAIFELTEHAEIKRMWVKDKMKRFLPLEIFTDGELTKLLNEFKNIFASNIEELMVTGKKQECIYPDFDRSKPNWFRAKFQKVYSSSFEAGIICEIEDITIEKAMSDQLKLHAAEMERVNNLLDIGLDISQMGGWEYDLDNNGLFVTKQIYDITGLEHHLTISYKQLLSLFETKYKISLLRTLKSSHSQLIPFDTEMELTSVLKRRKWIRLSGIPVLESGKVKFFRGILKDITHQKNNQLELMEAKNLAEQVARKRTEILSIMSHEIRTPLNGIIGICNLLNQIVFKNKKTASYINHLTFSSDHLLHLVNDILDLEKIDSKKMELQNKETNLSHLIQQIKAQFSPLAKEKNIALNTSCDKSIPSLLMIDELRLSRILNNLIGNAIKFTEAGEINITLKTIEQSNNFVKILFRVADTGIGIPEHFHNIIFDKFHQVQRTAHRLQQGTGLGLSITKGLLKLFKSDIALTSKPDQGTIFEFEIRFEKPRQKGETSLAVVKQIKLPLLPQFNLLIVDDNQINLLVTKIQVKNFGIDADLAESGFMGLEMMEHKSYQVILIDLHMPEMDGYALAKRVQNDYPETKIIVFTADILEEVSVRLKNMKISNILLKPFKPNDMHRILSKVLEAG